MAGWLRHDDVVLVDSGSDGGVSKDEIRFRFEGFVVKFLKEICAPSFIRPVPPMLGDGQRVDLYKLFMVVKGKGGYDAVCNSKLWDSVAVESGLGLSASSSVKLVYCKYLSDLDTLLNKVGDAKVPECGLVVDINRDKFGRRLMELRDEVQELLSDSASDEARGEFTSESNECCGTNGVEGLNSLSDGDKEVCNGGCPDLEMPDCVTNESFSGNLCKGKVSTEPVVDVSDSGAAKSMPGLSVGGQKCDGYLVLDESGSDKEESMRKRKRESMSDLLNWVTFIAKNPCDPEVGSMPEKSKWKLYGNQEIWKQVLLFREAVLIKRGFESSSEQHNWQSQKMHPCMYDDHLGSSYYNLRERLRCDERPLTGKPSSTVRCSTEPSVGTGDLDKTSSPLDGSPTVSIPLGSNHQADIPEWTGKTSESDPKWLGTRIWPSENLNSRLLIERERIGKGRQDSCGCPVPGSVECVRFHITEKRARVHLELGMAFYQWNFDVIGEEVRNLWTEEEEKKFKDLVLAAPQTPEDSFWDHIFSSFPKKTREDLVSYYFNAFLLRHRGYQNRHTPDNIDSDDDESEPVELRNVFGRVPLRNVAGHQTEKSRGSILLTPKKPQTKGR